MAGLTASAIKIPLDVVSEMAAKIQDESVIAKLCPSKPQLFKDTTHLVFNPSAEADIVEEGAAKSAYTQTFTPIPAKRMKLVTITRVSDELVWADEDDRLEIMNAIRDDQAGAMARGLDYGIFHAVNPKTGQPIPSYTALTKGAQEVTATDDISADMDSLEGKLVDYNITGLGLARPTAYEMRKLRIPSTGMRMYPEIPINLNATGNVDGLAAAVSNTVSGVKASSPTNVKAIMGDYSQIKWGLVRDMTAELIPYGDPDNTGEDLKGHGQVAFKTESVVAYAVVDPKAFAVLKSGLSA